MESLFSLNYLSFILPLRSDWLTAVMKGFTFLGDEVFFIVFFPVSYWLWNKSILARAGVVIFFSVFFNAWLKNLFEIPRPLIEHLVMVEVGDWSFPSGHAQYSTVVWGWLAYELKQLAVNQSRPVGKTDLINLSKFVYPIAAAIILAIGFSRIYLGVHYPVDVLAGIFIGLLTLFGYCFATTAEHTKWNALAPAMQSVILFVSIMCFFLVPHALTGAEIKGAGVFFGFATAVLYEKRYVNFDYRRKQSTATDMKSLAGIITLGYVGLLVIWIGLKALFSTVSLIPEVADFVRYMLLGLWVGFIAPYGFCRLGWRTRAVG